MRKVGEAVFALAGEKTTFVVSPTLRKQMAAQPRHVILGIGLATFILESWPEKSAAGPRQRAIARYL